MNRIAVNKFPSRLLLARWGIVAGLIIGLVAPTFGQTRAKLSAIKPGTERVQLIDNGDFQFQGPLVGNNHPFPSGWSGSVDMYANAGSNMVAINNGIVARAQESR